MLFRSEDDEGDRDQDAEDERKKEETSSTAGTIPPNIEFKSTQSRGRSTRFASALFLQRFFSRTNGTVCSSLMSKTKTEMDYNYR